MPKPNILLTSSFHRVARELREKSLLPDSACVAFIPTAGDPYPECPWIDADRKALFECGYKVRDVDLKNKTANVLEKEFAPFDVLFVAGGNTTYLVEQCYLSGFSSIIRELLRKGKFYIGSSAGSILAGPSVEPFVSEDLKELPQDFVLTNSSGLQLVDYIILPHEQIEQLSAAHEKIFHQYQNRFPFVKLTDAEYRVEYRSERV